MSNIFEYKDSVAFHPGYYLKEIVDESGITQEEFAKRLDTTPKNLSCLIRGEQSVSVDMAIKLARMLGTTPNYWLNLQNAFDVKIAEFESEGMIDEEKEVLRCIGYKYFREHFGLPDLERKTTEQIRYLRRFLKVATLTVFKKSDLAVSFRCNTHAMAEKNIIRANVMVQIAMNEALGTASERFDKKKLQEAIQISLEQTRNHEGFYPIVREAFLKAGVIFSVVPNLPGSQLNGATKKIGNRVMLMVSDRRRFSDTFWFTLFHEIGHILNDDYGVSFEEETGDKEELANKYAADTLINPTQYQEFVSLNRFSIESIRKFADQINRDPGIVLGRLQNDGYVSQKEWQLSKMLKHKYEVI